MTKRLHPEANVRVGIFIQAHLRDQMNSLFEQSPFKTKKEYISMLLAYGMERYKQELSEADESSS